MGSAAVETLANVVPVFTEPLTSDVPAWCVSTISSIFSAVVEVVEMVTVYSIVTEFEVEATAVPAAETVTPIDEETTPLKSIVVFVAMPPMSECLYWVPEEMMATGAGLSELGPGPIILNV